MSSNQLPFVSVLTPTYNRAAFLPGLIQCYKHQTYPKDRMEWIVIDDGHDDTEEIFMKDTVGIPNVRYIKLHSKLNIGAKRNRLNQEAKGDICVCMDDDDYYTPDRVAHAVESLQKSKHVQLAGCSELYVYYTKEGCILKLGPYDKYHATNGTLAYKSAYGKTHVYDEYVTYAEEKSFLEDYKNPLIQLNPKKVMLVMSHAENTFDKTDFLNTNSPFVQKTSLKLGDFIKNPFLIQFYSQCKDNLC